MTELKYTLSNGETRQYTCLTSRIEETKEELLGLTFGDGTTIMSVEVI